MGSLERKTLLSCRFRNSQNRPPGVLATELYRKEHGYFCHRPKGTRDWLIMHTVSGTGIVESASRAYECKQGDIVLIAPGTPQEFYTAENSVWEKMWCHFTPRPSFYSWLSFTENVGGVFHFRLDDSEIRDQVHKAFERLLHHNQSVRPMSEELAVNALEEIILLLSMYQREKEQAVLDQRIQEVVQFLMQNYAQKIQLKDLAQKVCLSPSRLTHLFKEQVGRSITDILQKHRLKQAARLLLSTNKSVLEICTEVGFNSPAFFTRKFMSFYGTSPGMYRKQNKWEGMKESS